MTKFIRVLGILILLLNICCNTNITTNKESSINSNVDSFRVDSGCINLTQTLQTENEFEVKIDTVYPGYPQIDTLQYLVDRGFMNLDSTEVNAVIRYSINPYHEFFNDQYYDVLGGALIRDSILFHQLVTESLKFTDFKRHKILCSIDEALGWHCFVNYVVEDVNYVVQDMDYTKFYKQTDSDEQTIIALQAFRDSLATDKEATICAMYGLKNDH